jgi:dihydroflavonol-4-reductase
MPKAAPPAKTVLVTGASGFIAKHICLQLLNEGYAVRGSVRSMARGQEVTDAVRPHLADAASLERLSFVELDLSRDNGWDKALEGVDVLIHTASPFPMVQPETEADVIKPAVEGTLRALRAAKAAGIKRVVMTSSTVAVTDGPLPGGKTLYEETEWTDTAGGTVSPYAKSKTLAERAAWDFVGTEAPEIELTAINPGFVLGPALDKNFGTSLQVIQRIIRSKDPALPQIGFMSVDVRDIAAMHVAAITNREAVGERIIGVSSFMWMPEMAEVVARELQDRRIVTRRAPNWLIHIIALFDNAVKGIAPTLDKRKEASNAKAKRIFGMKFIPVEDAVRASARYIADNNLA